MSLGALLKLGQLQPPVRRVLALDAGSRCIKLLLAESDFGRLRILKEELLDLQAEGLVSPDEIKTHLQARLEDWGNPPLALVLPQHLSISQVVDLPLAPESEVEKLIADETIKLGGVSESRIIYDFVRTEAPAKNRQQFWVTLCQEGDIRERILRLGVEQEELCEITTTANALIAAYRAGHPLSSRSVLVHLGAEATVVVILVAGQGAFATSFQMGSDFLTRTLARLRNCSEEAAESLKRSVNLVSGPEAFPEFVSALQGWVTELRRQLHEGFEHNPGLGPQDPAASAGPQPSALNPQPFDFIASGGGFDQPGLVDYLREHAGLNLLPWPKGGQPVAVSPSKGFEIAFGTALQALGSSAQPVSLLPEDYRLAWKKQMSRQRLEIASLILVAICFLVLGLGTWRQVSLITNKQALSRKVQAALEAAQENQEMTSELATDYENLRPIFLRQQTTLDTLKSLALLQQSRSNRAFWYVLLADQQSYFNPPATFLSTNRLARTNLLSYLERSRNIFPDFAGFPGTTNASPAKPGLISELCIPEEPEAARNVLGQLVNDLNKQKLFSKVDRLSDDLRRNLADPKVLLPDRDFVLSLDFAETQYQQPLFPKKPSAARAVRPAPKHLLRSLPASADNSTPLP
jgi:hypothetical protein